MILEAGSAIAGVIVDAVDEVLMVADNQIEQAPTADPDLIDDRLDRENRRAPDRAAQTKRDLH